VKILLEQTSTVDFTYADYEVSRSAGAMNGDFLHLDGGGPLRSAIDIARARGSLTVLDAGCGTGYGLSDFKDQVNFRAPLPDFKIDAHGIGLSDVRSQFDGGWRGKERLHNGYISLAIGNLATMPIKPDYYDIAYSYQVLLHNSQITPLVSNVISSLSQDGAYYFDTHLTQQQELDSLLHSLDSKAWDVVSKPLTRQFIGGEDTRVMTKLTRL
jgi:SAM-dependent methyltransferase